jgi:hypothetical protein
VKFWLRIIGALVIMLASLWQPVEHHFVSAQSTTKARIIRMDASGFPTIRLTADVFLEDGSFVSGLQPSEIKVLENNVTRPVDEVQETANAVGLIVAVNGGPIYANRISTKTHLQLIKEALVSWVPEAESLGKGDSVTLITNAGVKGVNLATPEEWTNAFNGLSAELAQATPSLTSLTRALEQASSAPLRPGMKTSILYITPLMSAGLAKAMDNLADQGAGAGIKVNIWLVAPASAKQPQAEQAINSLAERTGGQVFRFTGKESLPPIENYLQPLRRQYEIIFRSRVNKSGAQTVAFEVQANKAQARSPEENYEITLKTPNVMFVDPIEKVVLTWENNGNGKDELTPAFIPFNIHIEFPDNHPRNLTVTSLLVDGNSFAECNAPPCNRLQWPVSSLKTSGTYNLQVTIKDELGFSGKSVVLPLDVEIPAPPPSRWLDSVPTDRLGLAAGMILLGIIFIFLIRWRRIKAITRPAQKAASIRVDSKPLDRNVTVINLPRKSGQDLSAHFRESTGWLMPVDSGDALSTQPSIRLQEDVTTLGSSPIRSSVVIPSPSVDGLHVRILRKSGVYWLEDANSISGTWINGTPVSNLGTALTPGDVVRLGKVSFRFELRG